MTYSVDYTKKTGASGTIIVKAASAANDITNAMHLCYTGSNFCNPVEVEAALYIKPKKQGFAGSLTTK
jgi:hypothetical protein